MGPVTRVASSLSMRMQTPHAYSSSAVLVGALCADGHVPFSGVLFCVHTFGVSLAGLTGGDPSFG